MPNLLLSGRAQQLHGPLPLCCCQRFAGPSRLEKKVFVFDEKQIDISISDRRIASPSLRRAFPLVV